MSNEWRKSHQPLLPLHTESGETPGYALYPTFPLQGDEPKVSSGFTELALEFRRLAQSGPGIITVEGNSGVFWPDLIHGLDTQLNELGIRPVWHDTASTLKPAADLERMLEPFLGGDDPIFGRRYSGQLRDFFQDELPAAPAVAEGVLHVLYGPGAALFNWPGPTVYAEVPRNEVQYRLRAGSTSPLGAPLPAEPQPKPAYKRLFFVDWPAQERHLNRIATQIELFIDAQDPSAPRAVRGEHLRETMRKMARSPFRVRPWFEIGPWGGQWLKQHIQSLPREEINYAWSFELITPENGLLLSSNGRQLEVSFLWLMALQAPEVLGEAASRFGTHFPIRFNYLDTVHGGNLSLQVHPSSEYVREHFSHGLTQDETYYLVRRRQGTPEPVVFLGFRDDINLPEFRAALEQSLEEGTELAADRFVNSVPAVEHELYLIPNGIIHSAGEGSLVLEISATTYLFTLKLYDWQRLDVDGKPRPINLQRGFDNLDPTRTPAVIQQEHISRPKKLAEGSGWLLEHLPTHERHFFDVHRFRLEPGASVNVNMSHQFHVLNVVDGQTVEVRGENGEGQDFSFAETFVLPAGTGSYSLHNTGTQTAMVVKAFVKPGRGEWRTDEGMM